jgi:hypothetical protein
MIRHFNKTHFPLPLAAKRLTTTTSIKSTCKSKGERLAILKTTHASTRILNALVEGAQDDDHKVSATNTSMGNYKRQLDTAVQSQGRFQPSPMSLLEPIAFEIGQFVGKTLGQKEAVVNVSLDASKYICNHGLRHGELLDEHVKSILKDHRDNVEDIPENLQTTSASLGQLLLNLSRVHE